MDDNSFSLFDNINPEQVLPPYQREIQLMSALKSTNYLIPCKSGKKGAGLEMAMLISPDGERFLPAYTHPKELTKWPFEQHQAILQSFDNIKYLILNDSRHFFGVIINPFGQKLILRQEHINQIDLCTEGMCVKQVKHSKNLRLLQPERSIPEMVDQLKVFFSQHEEVYSVYLMMILEPEETEKKWLFLIDFHGEKIALFPEVIEVVRRYLSAGENFEVMKANYHMLNMASKTCIPIYQKVF